MLSSFSKRLLFLISLSRRGLKYDDWQPSPAGVTRSPLLPNQCCTHYGSAHGGSSSVIGIFCLDVCTSGESGGASSIFLLLPGIWIKPTYRWWRLATRERRASWPGWCNWGWGCSSPAQVPRTKRQWSRSPQSPDSLLEGRGGLGG